jgi:hypothetical protein
LCTEFCAIDKIIRLFYQDGLLFSKVIRLIFHGNQPYHLSKLLGTREKPYCLIDKEAPKQQQNQGTIFIPGKV